MVATTETGPRSTKVVQNADQTLTFDDLRATFAAERQLEADAIVEEQKRVMEGIVAENAAFGSQLTV